LIHQRGLISAASFRLIKYWIGDCFNKHLLSCPYNPNNSLPRRIVDVGLSNSNSSNSSIRMVEQRKTGAWVSLSHCWVSQNHFTTTLNTIVARKKSIDFQELPLKFQDAVMVTRNLASGTFGFILFASFKTVIKIGLKKQRVCISTTETLL
jgi:hypothetical protein